MKEVTKEKFDEFLKDKMYLRRQGMFMHSEDYVDFESREVIAYYESSSYGAPDIFKIKQDNI